MRDQTIIGGFQQLDNKIHMMDQQLIALTNVMKEIVGKELLRGQALHKVLMDKNLFTDAELKVALETLMADAKADLEAQQKQAAEEKQNKIELLVPAGAKLTPNEPVATQEQPSEVKE